MSEDRDESQDSQDSADETLEGATDADAAPMDDLFLSPDSSDGEVFEGEGTDPEEAPAGAADPAVEPPGGDAGGVSGEALAQAEGRASELQEQLDAVSAERDDFKNRLMRSAADLENFRRRTAKEKEDLRKYGIDKVVLELLPVIDNLERALEHADTGSGDSIADGVRMVHKQFVGALAKHGVKGFDSKGLPFDPQRHEAIQQVDTAEHETGTVLEVFQRGYYLHERLIRPALVVVARRIEGSETPAGELESEPTDDAASDDAVDVMAGEADVPGEESTAAPSDDEAAGGDESTGGGSADDEAPGDAEQTADEPEAPDDETPSEPTAN